MKCWKLSCLPSIALLITSDGWSILSAAWVAFSSKMVNIGQTRLTDVPMLWYSYETMRKSKVIEEYMD